MLDTIRLTYEEYENIIANTGKILEEKKYYFDEIFRTEEVAINAYNLCVERNGRGRMFVTYSYNLFTKVLTVGIGKEKQEQIVFTADIPTFDNENTSVNFHIKYNIKDDVQQMKWIAQCQQMNVTPLDAASNFARTFWCINFYLKNLPETQEIVKEKVEEVYVENKKGNKRYKSRVVLKRTIQIHAKPFNKKDIKHVIKCLCWGVRGHERHLKNGTIVWVKPYRKGKQRNNENVYKAKEYITNEDRNV